MTPSTTRSGLRSPSLNVPVGAHVGGGTAFNQVGRAYFPNWSVVEPCAVHSRSQIACLSFTAGESWSAHPTLRLVFLESGAGWVPLARPHARRYRRKEPAVRAGAQPEPVEYFQRQCYISADPDDPGMLEVIREIGDENIVTATDFGHVEGQGYSHAIDDTLALEGVSEDSKRKIMWDNPVRLYALSE